MKWHKFSDKTPYNSWLWITDNQTVWLRHIAYLEDSDRDLMWAKADIQYPSVPKNDNHMHYCKKKNENSTHGWECFESFNCEKLYLRMIWNDEIDEIECEICPFCGYEAKKE